MTVAFSIISTPGSRIKPAYPFETFQYECCCGTRAYTFFTVTDALDAGRTHIEQCHPLGWETPLKEEAKTP